MTRILQKLDYQDIEGKEKKSGNTAKMNAQNEKSI
jgi:hypothetical protein